jgi:hypothetical protein
MIVLAATSGQEETYLREPEETSPVSIARTISREKDQQTEEILDGR